MECSQPLVPPVHKEHRISLLFEGLDDVSILVSLLENGDDDLLSSLHRSVHRILSLSPRFCGARVGRKKPSENFSLWAWDSVLGADQPLDSQDALVHLLSSCSSSVPPTVKVLKELCRREKNLKLRERWMPSDELKQVTSFGFLNVHHNVRFLDQFSGDVQKTVAALRRARELRFSASKPARKNHRNKLAFHNPSLRKVHGVAKRRPGSKDHQKKSQRHALLASRKEAKTKRAQRKELIRAGMQLLCSRGFPKKNRNRLLLNLFEGDAESVIKCLQAEAEMTKRLKAQRHLLHANTQANPEEEKESQSSSQSKVSSLADMMSAANIQAKVEPVE